MLPSGQSVVGRLIRLPLRLLPRRLVVPVLSGPLRGAKWLVGAFTHGAWLGTYEQYETSRFAKMVREGAVVYDIGAHVGYYTLLASRLVGATGKVYSFEPLPANVTVLREHLRLNESTNVRVIAAALGTRAGRARFTAAAHSSMGHLDGSGEIEVEVVTLDSLNLPPPDVIKMDIEGAERDVLPSLAPMLEAHRPLIFLSTHGHDIQIACRRFLESLGYALTALDERPVELTSEILAAPPSRT